MASKEPKSYLQLLSDKDRNKVKKASSERIRAELVKVGVSQGELDKLSREQLVERYAEAIHAGTAQAEEEVAPSVAEEERAMIAEAVSKYSKSGMSQDWDLQIRLEEMRIAADERRRAADKEECQAQREAEERQRAAEREAEVKRMEHEREMKQLDLRAQQRAEEL